MVVLPAPIKTMLWGASVHDGWLAFRVNEIELQIISNAKGLLACRYIQNAAISYLSSSKFWNAQLKRVEPHMILHFKLACFIGQADPETTEGGVARWLLRPA